MAETVQQLVDDIRTEGGFDVDEDTALRWLDRRHKRACARARSFRKTVSFGTTTAGTAFYALNGVTELLSLEIGGVPYSKARRPDVYGYSQDTLLWVGNGGFIVEDASPAGVRGVTLIPTPEETGTAITGYAAMVPPSLTLDPGDGGLLQIDDDLVDDLVAGAMATGFMRRRRPDAAAAYEARFDEMCKEFEVRTRRRFRGAGPAQIRVQGINA